jgi:hypothetical protein
MNEPVQRMNPIPDEVLALNGDPLWRLAMTAVAAAHKGQLDEESRGAVERILISALPPKALAKVIPYVGGNLSFAASLLPGGIK